MKNIKLYFFSFLLLCIILLSAGYNARGKKIDFLKDEGIRKDSNIENLLSENRQITSEVYRQKEVTGRVKSERDSLAKKLDIKPKQITKIITITNTVHDTVSKLIPVVIEGRNEWTFTDTTKCLKVAYNAKLVNDSLIVRRTLLEDKNKTTQTFYKKAPHVWFIRTGKWKYLQKIESTCGEPVINTIQFIK